MPYTKTLLTSLGIGSLFVILSALFPQDYPAWVQIASAWTLSTLLTMSLFDEFNDQNKRR